jgi:ATPase
MRNTDDFNLFADLRLSGVGMIGIVHATNAVDSIQRFMNRVELGVIPQIIDTVLFIKFGEVNKVLNLGMTVKCPSGMTEADLARPVVEVRDFETGKLEYEIYTYGEQTVVMPIKKTEGTEHAPMKNIASKSIQQEMMNYTSRCEVEVLSDHKCRVYVPEKDISKIIGKQGATINQIEKRLGVNIEVEELKKMDQKEDFYNKESSMQTSTEKIPYQLQISKKSVEFNLGTKYKHKELDIVVDGEYLLSAKVSNAGTIKIHKKNKFGKILETAYKKHGEIVLK